VGDVIGILGIAPVAHPAGQCVHRWAVAVVHLGQGSLVASLDADDEGGIGGIVGGFSVGQLTDADGWLHDPT
jgi:hypothetical protein